MKYRAEIDGLRALAVVPVILFHAGFDSFSGGFVGVDIFFVISGYLITAILINDIEKDRFSLIRFYERRARRILPALFAVMCFCIPFAWLWMLPDQMKSFSKSLVAVSFFASNILFYRESGYFEAAAEDKPLLHTWSLAVEEQYYVFFPVFLFFAWRFGKNKVFWTIVIFATLSLALSEWGWRNKPSANFYLAPARIWELFAGSIAAFIVNKHGVRANNTLSFVGLASILFAIFVYDESTPFPSIYALVPVVGVVLLVLFAKRETVVAKLLSTKIFVGIGLISYSAYLWHQPLFAFARIKMYEDPSLPLMTGLSVCSFLLAVVSWKYIENPFRAGKNRFFTGAFIFSSSALGLLAISIIGYGGYKSEGFVDRYTTPSQVRNEYKLPLIGDGYCFYNFNNRTLEVGMQGIECDLGVRDSDKLSILLFGDSYAAHWEPFFKMLANDYSLRLRSITTNWCFPTGKSEYTAPRGHISREQCNLNREWVESNYSSYDLIVLGAAWHRVFESGYQSGVFNMINYLLENSKIKLIVFDIPPQFTRGTVESALYKKDVELKLRRSSNDLGKLFWKELVISYGKSSRINLVSHNDMDFGQHNGYKTDAGYPYSLDGGHISVYGAREIYRKLQESGDIKALFKIGR